MLVSHSQPDMFHQSGYHQKHQRVAESKVEQEERGEKRKCREEKREKKRGGGNKGNFYTGGPWGSTVNFICPVHDFKLLFPPELVGDEGTSCVV